ncbi:hypothetical protein TNCV_286061 [Trichonephila clavipes]|nr:hypothetical protein TNCV_286061 [Trichonephila clavipes]
MQYATVLQLLTTVSPYSNRPIMMLQEEVGFVSKHTVVLFRCPCPPFISRLVAQTPVFKNYGVISKRPERYPEHKLQSSQESPQDDCYLEYSECPETQSQASTGVKEGGMSALEKIKKISLAIILESARTEPHEHDVASRLLHLGNRTSKNNYQLGEDIVKIPGECVVKESIVGELFGPPVFVNGDRYRARITNFFIPELNNHDVQELWFQQDGATCHTARATIDLLKDTFGDRLISRFGPVNLPPRSCDLTPLDYFLWGYVKSLVYADKPQTLDHLEDNIRRVIADIRPQMLEKVLENWTSRLDYIRASRGSRMPEIIFKM